MAAAIFAQTAPSNIVIILADDLGYGDVSMNGCRDYSTPNIDSIASNGTLCTNGYVTHPFCSPSRAGLITGRYQQRFGHENQPVGDNSNPRLGLPASEIILPQVLKPAGYVCGAVGKWHLGYALNLRPTARGFDEFFGFLGASSPYYNAKLFRNNTSITESSYLTDAFTREGVSFINRHASQPFFLYLAYNAVHAPYNTPPQTYMDRVANISNSKRRTYAAMVVALDDGLGQILQTLQTNNIVDKTLVFFLSDNGAAPHPFTRNLPLRGYKFDMLEGGVRIPFAVQWPGHIPTGTTYDAPVSSLDIVPTAAAVAALSLPIDRSYDGLNIVPYLAGQQTAPQRTLFWRWFGLGKSGPPGSIDTISAVRNGPLKLVTERAKAGQPPALYNLPSDIGETQDLSSTQPQDADSLKKLYDQWETQTIAPLWQDATKFPDSLVLAGDWNSYNAGDPAPPWHLARTTAPSLNGTPDAFVWFTSTIHVAATGGDTTQGVHSFAIVGNNSYAKQWGGVTVTMDNTTSVPFQSGNALGPTNSISFQSNFYYSFRIISPLVDSTLKRPARLSDNLKIAVIQTSALPITVSRTGQTPDAPTAGQPVDISIAASQPKAPEERIYLRWSTDFFVTSHMVEATGSGPNYSATIPGQPAGTAVEYAIVTSTSDLSLATTSAGIDALTLSTIPVFKVQTSE